MSAAAWLWLALILEVGIVDGLLWLARKPSLSQWLWRQYRRHRWARWAVLGVIVAVTLHLVFEFWGQPSPPDPPVDACDGVYTLAHAGSVQSAG